MTTTPPLRALVSRAALRRNARRALGSAGEDAAADLRRDAWGHGIALVAPALREAGVHRALADDADAPALASRGMTRAEDARAVLDAGLLYGLPGSGGEPVMRLLGRVLSLKALLAGEGVSYNYAHIAPRDTRIALVTGGFGQGVSRAIGNHARVEVRGALAPIVGRVAMDVCVVDVGALPEVERGDDVVYFGGDGPARDGLADWADASGLTAAELVCAVGLHSRREESA